jgi:hypothetical protein
VLTPALAFGSVLEDPLEVADDGDFMKFAAVAEDQPCADSHAQLRSTHRRSRALRSFAG